MNEIYATVPISLRRIKLPRLNFPGLASGASLTAIAILLGDALDMAYTDPYASRRDRPPVAPDVDLEGRDPSW